jgi:hypothetical protein
MEGKTAPLTRGGLSVGQGYWQAGSRGPVEPAGVSRGHSTWNEERGMARLVRHCQTKEAANR